MCKLIVCRDVEISQRDVSGELEEVDRVQDVYNSLPVVAAHEVRRQPVLEIVTNSAELLEALVVEADKEAAASRVVLTAVCAVGLLVPSGVFLRRLALVDFTEEGGAGREAEVVSLDPKTLALARLAALIAEGGAVSSYSELADAAVSSDATPDDCVDVLVDIVEIVGAPRVVEAAPKLALALGHDIESALEGPS